MFVEWVNCFMTKYLHENYHQYNRFSDSPLHIIATIQNNFIHEERKKKRNITIIMKKDIQSSDTQNVYQMGNLMKE